MVILVRHRRQMRDVGVQPVSATRLRRRRRRGREPSTTSPAEAAGFVDSDRGSARYQPASSPELSRRGVQRPRPPRRAPSPFQVVQPTSPTSPPGQVHLPPRDSPVFVHVESPRESPLLGRAPGANGVLPGVLPASVDVSPPLSMREESPIWVRLQEEPAAPDGTLAVPGEPPRAVESPVWVHFAFDDTPSTTASAAAAVPAVPPSSPSASPSSSTVAGPAAPGRAVGVVQPSPLRPGPARATAEPGEPDTLSRSFSNPYRQDTYRPADRPARTSQRPRQRRLLRFD